MSMSRQREEPTSGTPRAADHPGSAVSSGQPRTTTPQVNPPVPWQVNCLNLAYNDESSTPEQRQVELLIGGWKHSSCPACNVDPHRPAGRWARGGANGASELLGVRRDIGLCILALGLSLIGFR